MPLSGDNMSRRERLQRKWKEDLSQGLLIKGGALYANLITSRGRQRGRLIGATQGESRFMIKGWPHTAGPEDRECPALPLPVRLECALMDVTPRRFATKCFGPSPQTRVVVNDEDPDFTLFTCLLDPDAPDLGAPSLSLLGMRVGTRTPVVCTVYAHRVQVMEREDGGTLAIVVRGGEGECRRPLPSLGRKKAPCTR